MKKVLAVAAVLASSQIFAAAIPARYQELTYIQSAGAQWINTGYVPAGTDTIVAKVRYNEAGTGKTLSNDNKVQYLFAAVAEESDDTCLLGFCRWSNKTSRFYRNNVTASPGTNFNLGLIIGVSANGDTLLGDVNGQQVKLSDAEFGTPKSLYLFGRQSGDGATGCAYLRIYRLRVIDKDGRIVRDYRPVKDTQAVAGSVAECGVYDVVGGTFCPNLGTAAFTAGGAVSMSDPGENDLYAIRAGTTTLVSPVTYAKLYNIATDGEVRFDQSEVDVDAAHKNSFTGFFADQSGTTTVFDGGFWDFGAAAGSKVCNFMGDDYLHSRSVVIEGGAVITNVGKLAMAGQCTYENGGINVATKNSLRLTGGSTLAVNQFALSTAAGNNIKSALTIDGGSKLLCAGQLVFSQHNCTGNSRWNSGTTAVVSNANTTVEVGGNLDIGANTDPDVNGSTGGGNASGGNTMTVTDKAYLRASVINLGGGNRCFDNVLVISGTARVDCAAINVTALNTNTKYDGNASGAGDKLMILDGAVVTNTGRTAVSYAWGSTGSGSGSEIVVSNATFYTETFAFSLSCNAANNIFRMSGPGARFTIGTTKENDYHPFGAQSPGHNFWIFENGAKWRWPWTRWNYTDPCHDQTVIVRTGATLSFNQMAMTTQTSGSGSSYDNRLIVESGACATGGVCYVGNTRNTLSVSNATLKLVSDWQKDTINSQEGSALTVGGPLTWHGPATNDVLELWGDEPKVELTAGGADFWNESYCDFHLPTNGYKEGVIPITVAKAFRMRSGCHLRFYGLEELCAYQKDVVGKTGKYMLIKAKSIVLPDDVMAEALAALPENCSLRIVDTDDGRKALVLKVRVPAGQLLLVR